MRSLYDVPAPAKLNLFLHLTGRRSDGYHLLQSAFMLIDWCDRISFETRSDGDICRRDTHPEAAAALPTEDLCVLAARALQAATGTSLGVDICLDKQIPTQAGMGGGSSDAATCLLALQRLWGVRLPLPILHAMALKLGADVPFFLTGGHAWVEGIGDSMTPLRLPSTNFVVVKPEHGVSTSNIFRDPALKRDTGTATMQGFADYSNGLNGQVTGFGQNDLQPVAQALCPEIFEVLAWLASQQLVGRMTGSGSAVFAQVDEAWQAAVAPGEWTVRKCRSLDQHPLLGW